MVKPDHGGNWVSCHWSVVTNLHGRPIVDEDMEVEYQIRLQPDGKIEASWLTVTDKRWWGNEESNDRTANSPSKEASVQAAKGEAPPEPASQPELPAGWEMVQSKSSGRTYYYNAATGVSQNEIPVESRQNEDGVRKPATSAEQLPGLAERLPPDWTKLQSSRTGEHYYYNTKTGISQKEFPLA